jgi:hypothetical protein
MTAAFLFLPAVAAAQRQQPLRVIRSTPPGDASPLAQITVSFDRPVIGSMESSVDARTIMRIEPAVPARVEWRDPVTIRLVPAAPLVPGQQYTITVANNFRALDGSRLTAPFQFSFRTQGPTLLTGTPVGPPAELQRPLHIAPNQRFELVFTSAVDLATLAGAAYMEFGAACSPQRIVRLRGVLQRTISSDDPWNIRNAGGWQRDRSLDSLRRIAVLEPVTPMPRGCAAELVSPVEVQSQYLTTVTRWGFNTYGDFAVRRADCGPVTHCPTGPLQLEFSTPVRGAEIQRHVRVIPDGAIVIRDTLSESSIWYLERSLAPRTGYTVVIDSTIRDVFGQQLRGRSRWAYSTTGYAPTVNYPFGDYLVERVGFGTMSIQHVNVDTLVTWVAAVPDSLEAQLLSRRGWGYDSAWVKLAPFAVARRYPQHTVPDRPMVASLPVGGVTSSIAPAPTLFAVRMNGGGATPPFPNFGGPIALVQVTDLAVHARVGVSEGTVWVTGVSDGRPREGATVVLHDARGVILTSGRTDAQGLARLAGWNPPRPDSITDGFIPRYGFDGFIKVALNGDRAAVPVNWDPDLSPWRFGVNSAWAESRRPMAGAVFTERGIYRPGERVFAKVIIRDGPLGALRSPVRDSVKWVFSDRNRGVLRDTVTMLSAFGTSDQSITIAAGAPVGTYMILVAMMRQGAWRTIAEVNYRVAEYRPPEFLVEASGDSAIRFPGESFTAAIGARYLFGAPMGLAPVTWTATSTSMSPWQLSIPGAEGWYLGSSGSWWEEDRGGTVLVGSGIDTLDASGQTSLSVVSPQSTNGRAASLSIEVAVTDVNRQVVGARAATVVHPALFYIAARPAGSAYFWSAGTPVAIDLMAVRPSGEKMIGAPVEGTVVRREWHRVRRERNGVSQVVGEWVADTVARCSATSAATASRCQFTPPTGGIYEVSFASSDADGRAVRTSFQRYATGSDFVPWNDESQFKMDVLPDRARYSVGDTATVLFAAPFVEAEAWITVEREGIIEQRRVRITSGSTTLRFPITEAYSPNAFISIIVVRGRSAPPGSLDDPGRPTMRVGYAQLRVTPEVKRLNVTLTPHRSEYRPGDSARVQIAVRNAASGGERSEVTLWAVDEGVLSLTGYRTPDPLDLIYRERGLGLRLVSNLTSVAPQVPEGEKGRREPGGGGGTDAADVLRSRFQTTAFFLGSVITDASGNATASAKLPDNLTTFRLMAVAVTSGDRYGNGQSNLLVTRPLVARPALPRFVRPGDVFVAGTAINRRDGAAAGVTVRSTVTGVNRSGSATRTVTLPESRGTEVRFPFTAIRGDSAKFRFDARSGGDSDAVLVTIPVKPDYHPVVHTLAGILRDQQNLEFILPATIDPARSRLSINVGTSPLALIRGIRDQLRIYPYLCTEQVVSTITPTLALYRAQLQTGARLVEGNPALEIARAVELLRRRQREDGSIGYWSSSSWSTPWLSAYAGMVLIEARELGVAVDSAVLGSLANYVRGELRGGLGAAGRTRSGVLETPVADWYQIPSTRLRDQVAAVDFLSRTGSPDIAMENELVRGAGLLAMEDRARLAEVVARRGQVTLARQLMVPLWAATVVEGRRAFMPDTARTFFYFDSRIRPLARMLSATLAVEPQHQLVAPLVESLTQEARAGAVSWMWNTQDYAAAVQALSAFERRRSAQGSREVTVRSANSNRVVMRAGENSRPAGTDSTIALSGLLSNVRGGGRALRLALTAAPGDGLVYYFVNVSEVPSRLPVTPLDNGIKVERWYESYPEGRPVTSVVEGELVRVRLRLTVPTSRQFVVLDDALPAGLEAVDLSLRTASALPGPGSVMPVAPIDQSGRAPSDAPWRYGRWDSGWWSAFDHREIRDDRVVYSATVLWPGTYSATYVARATIQGRFIRPPAHAEEMYNPAVNGRSDGGTFTVRPRPASERREEQ